MQGQLEREALLDTPAAAAYLNVDEYTIHRLTNRGLPADVPERRCDRDQDGPESRVLTAADRTE
jgi:hypothetical protein